MYVVALLACLMYRHPGITYFPFLLANAKLASAVLCLYLFLAHQPYLIYLVNCTTSFIMSKVSSTPIGVAPR